MAVSSLYLLAALLTVAGLLIVYSILSTPKRVRPRALDADQGSGIADQAERWLRRQDAGSSPSEDS